MASADKNQRTFLRRGIAMLCVVLCASALGAYAWFDVAEGVRRMEHEAEGRLATTAESIDRLVNAEQARLAASLRATRTELRAKNVWSGEVRGETDGTESVDPRPDSGEIDARRLEAVLRNALERAEGVFALEVVVAGHDGLKLYGVERGEDGIGSTHRDPKQADGLAKSLWYSDEVSRAVESAGRGVEQSEISFEAPALAGDALERPFSRTVIALHEPGELVQGALVAVSDRSQVEAALSPIVPSGVDLALVSMEGQPLGLQTPDRENLSALAGEVFTREAWTEPVPIEGRLVLGRPLGAWNGGSPMLLAVLQTPAPPPVKSPEAWWATSWPVAIGLSSVLAALAIFGLSGRGFGASGTGQDAKRTGLADDPADEIEIRSQDVVTREWLADIRGCLEREAAVRGLGLDLRCATAVPDDVSCDPAWLGGLLVAMGREALDATPDEAIALEVTGSETGLRFEIEAGEVALAPIAGMQTIARALGARFESGHDGRLSLVVPA